MFKNIKTFNDIDILVIGAGSARSVAASAAASGNRYNVRLVKRYGFTGGTSTQMPNTFYGFFRPGEAPMKIVGELADEGVNYLNDSGEIFLRPTTLRAGTGINYDPERLKDTGDDLLLHSGVRDLYLYFNNLFITNPSKIFSSKFLRESNN
ncbi:MAG TPA: FAD-dependent oxidoreductase [Chitinophagaceae bacterium]|nr:FAD-dependent oxidoreductase [Chitinophagaceae bacterium]